MDVAPTAAGGAEDELSVSVQIQDSDGPDVPSVETPSPPPSPIRTPPSSASQGLGLFQWSGSSSSTEQSKTPKSSSGLAALQQFQYTKGFSCPAKACYVSAELSVPQPSPPDRRSEDKEDSSDSPPSQDSAYFSQSQSIFTSFSLPSSLQEDAPSVCFTENSAALTDVSKKQK